MTNTTEEDQALKMISDSLSWESLDAVPPSEIKQLQGRIVSALAAVREKAAKDDIDAALAELREMFPERDYIRVKVGLTWFGGENAPDTLARITVNSLEWSAPTLSEAMQKVREWAAIREPIRSR